MLTLSALVKNGAKVYLVSRKLSQCEEAAAELNKVGTTSLYMSLLLFFVILTR